MPRIIRTNKPVKRLSIPRPPKQTYRKHGLSHGSAGRWKTAEEITYPAYVCVAADYLVDGYEDPNGNGGSFFGYTGGNQSWGQSFLGNGEYLKRVGVQLFRRNDPPDANVICSIFAHSGTFGSTGVPTGSALATASIPSGRLNQNATQDFQWEYFDFDGTLQLADGTPYFLAISVDTPGPNSSNSHGIGWDNSSPVAPGNSAFQNAALSWAAYPTSDLMFAIWTDEAKDAADVKPWNIYPILGSYNNTGAVTVTGRNYRQLYLPSSTGLGQMSTLLCLARIRVQVFNDNGAAVNVDSLYFGEYSGAGGNFAATPTQITFDGASGFVLDPGETRWSDWVDVSWPGTTENGWLFAFKFSNSPFSAVTPRTQPVVSVGWYKTDSADESSLVTISGYSDDTGGTQSKLVVAVQGQAGTDVFTTAYLMSQLASPGGPFSQFNDVNVRQIFQASNLTDIGITPTQVRFLLYGRSSGLSGVESMYVGYPNLPWGAGEANFNAAPVPVITSRFSLQADEYRWTEWIDFVVDGTDDIMIALRVIDGRTQFSFDSPFTPGGDGYIRTKTGADESSLQNVTGYAYPSIDDFVMVIRMESR